MEQMIEIREADRNDYDFVVNLMQTALGPYYGGDHVAHARKIFGVHIAGGRDSIGFFSYEQKMFLLMLDGMPAGMVHLVGKRQGTYKISPLIIAPDYQGRFGLGSYLLEFAQEYARTHGGRQLYCTVAEQNMSATQFFLRKGFTIAGRSDSHYKVGITELMMYKIPFSQEAEESFDRPNISVLPCSESYESQVRKILLDILPRSFKDIDHDWVDALFSGYRRRSSLDINEKFKLIFIALDRQERVLGVAGATPKKGEPIKIMPFISVSIPAFLALLVDVPFLLKPYGRKLYVHLIPGVQETMALQQQGWKFDAALPGAYHDDYVTQQWGFDITGETFMRTMRLKNDYLKMIKSGKKTLEVRVGYDNIKTIQRGERIRFLSRSDTLYIRVADIRQYQSFTEMIENEDHSRIAPGRDKPQVLGLLQEIYPPNKESLGVFVLDLQTDNLTR